MMNQDAPQKKQFDTAIIMKTLRPFVIILKKHLVFLFIILALSALLYASFAVRSILDTTTVETEDSSHTYSTNFDQATIKKIDTLNTQSATQLPAGRSNPFSE